MAKKQPTIWDLDPHTKAKHDLLRIYLGGWFPILSTYNGRIVFLDGFAGPGSYTDGSPGSPVIALETLLSHSHFPRMSGCEFLSIFCENDKKRVDNLQAEIEALIASKSPWPANIKIRILHEEFSETARDLIDTLSAQKARLAPTFAFVDPFGFSGLPMQVLADLLSFPRCELFVNYMVDHVNRFATAGNVDNHLEELFGTDEYLDVDGTYGPERQQFLHDLYGKRLKETCQFDYVQSFGMINKAGHIAYYLFYGTRSLTGLRLMKDAMWKVAPGGDYRFSDRLAGQDILFTEENLVAKPLRTALLAKFPGQEVSITEIEDFVLVFTPYRPAHVRKHALTPLERAGKIVVNRPGKSGFPAGTTIQFP